METVSSRIRTFVVTSTLLVLVIGGLAAWVVGNGINRQYAQAARQRAFDSVDLLVNVGPNMPHFTPALIEQGLTDTQAAALDRSVERGQRSGRLSDVTVWDRRGRVVYSNRAELKGTRPPLEEEVVTTLSGTSVTRLHRDELDAASGAHTGVIDAFEPLRAGGQVYGAVEVSLSLRLIEQETSQVRRDVLAGVVAGTALLWLLVLPFAIRLARAVARDWTPRRRRILRDFRAALARDEIELAYQPQIDPAAGRVIAVEALVRWRRHGTLVPPAEFLPIIETSPLMPALTDRVIDLALGQLATWRAAGLSLRMSVNLSATDLSDLGLAARIVDHLERYGLDGKNLTVEVTETAIVEDAQRAREVLTALADAGVEIAVDDFGTGHASISRLYSMPVSEIKVDRSFVSEVDPRSRAYLTAIVGFGKNLGLRVVAEGVEDAASQRALAELGCDLAQGFHISRPLPAAELTPWLDECVGVLTSATDPAPTAVAADRRPVR